MDNTIKNNDGSAELVRMMGVESLIPSVTNPRKHFDEVELAHLVASVGKHGILQPLVVRAGVDDVWEIVCGERRWRAAQEVGMVAVPAQVKDLSDREVIEIQMSENIDRDALTVYEEACGVRSLTACGCSADEITDRLGRDGRWVQTRLGIFDLPEVMRAKVEADVYGVRVVEQVLRVDEDELENACQAVLGLGDDLTESQVKEMLALRYFAPNQRRKDWRERCVMLREVFADHVELIDDVEMVGEYIRAWGDPVGNWVTDKAAVKHEAARVEDEGVLWSALAAAHGIKQVLVPVGDVKAGEVILLVDSGRVREVEAALRENGDAATLGARRASERGAVIGDQVGDDVADAADDVPGEEVFTVSITVPGLVLVSRELVVGRDVLDGAERLPVIQERIVNECLNFTSEEQRVLADYFDNGKAGL